MNEKLKIEINLLHNLDEVSESENFPFDSILLDVCGNANTPWEERWNARFDYVKPGIGVDSIIAVEGSVVTDRTLDLSEPMLGSFVKDYFSHMLSEDDVLSCVVGSTQRSPACHFLLFPLEGRQLDPWKWIDSRTTQLSKKIKNDFIKKLGEYFLIDLSSEISEEQNGHTKYLDSFPPVQTAKEDIREVIYTTITEEEQVQTDFPKDKIKDIINTAVKYFTTGVDKGTYIRLVRGDISLETYLSEVRKYLRRVYSGISERDIDLVVKKVKSAAKGFYILDDLINDPAISDIKVVSPWKIRVKVNGARRTSNLHFIDESDYINFLNNLLLRYGLSSDKQIHVFTDKNANENFILRNNITLGMINSGYPVYHIRKISKSKYDIEGLINAGMMDQTTANYLLWAAREAKGIVFTGKGSSGKTTLMNTLLEYTPSNASGLVIQESEELFSNKPEMTFEHILPKSATDDTEYDLKELAKNGLLTDIDYFIIGEVKGEEAMYFINACDTGNKGWCSVHSPSSEEAINKLADYVMYASKYNREEALYMLKELQVVVFLKNFKVAEISEVIGWDEKNKRLKYRTVLRRDDLVTSMRPPA